MVLIPLRSTSLPPPPLLVLFSFSTKAILRTWFCYTRKLAFWSLGNHSMGTMSIHTDLQFTALLFIAPLSLPGLNLSPVTRKRRSFKPQGSFPPMFRKLFLFPYVLDLCFPHFSSLPHIPRVLWCLRHNKMEKELCVSCSGRNRRKPGLRLEMGHQDIQMMWWHRVGTPRKPKEAEASRRASWIN